MLARLRPLIAVTATCALAALVPAVAAGGGYETYETSVGISGKYPAFSGKLTSGYAFCKSSRKVKLYSEMNGPDKLLGSVLSDSGGKWKIDYSDKLSSGAYYASVTKKSSSEIAVICAAAKSKVIPVD